MSIKERCWLYITYIWNASASKDYKFLYYVGVPLFILCSNVALCNALRVLDSSELWIFIQVSTKPCTYDISHSFTASRYTCRVTFFTQECINYKIRIWQQPRTVGTCKHCCNTPLCTLCDVVFFFGKVQVPYPGVVYYHLVGDWKTEPFLKSAYTYYIK
jgi:hypothetical protein